MSGGTGTVTGRCPPNGPELGSGAGTAFHRSTDLPLGCLPTAPACARARAHADAVLHEWGLAHLADDAVMIVSELTTNAYDASVIWPDKPPITLRLRADDTRLLIEVWDHSPDDPAPAHTQADSEVGRGLMIVDALAARWGVERHGRRVKAVWAEVKIPGTR
ncbi:MAG TPA: ATP-binding protein [Streptosporangiaceae bacterium]|jgi:anti-sigma regulatory factor (Ser/Thr protein kinase)